MRSNKSTIITFTFFLMTISVPLAWGLAPWVPGGMWDLVTTRPPTQPNDADFQRGLVNVLNYGATPNVSSDDDTAAIQAALYDAYKHQLVCYFPTGTYDITGTLDCDQANNNRRYAYILQGQKGATRPVIRLKNGSSGFTNSNVPTPILKIWGRKSSGEEFPGQCFNNIIRGIDFVTGTNAGASGIYFTGAQGCSVEDVRIDATNGHSGFLKSIGTNGGYYNIEVEGGRYALYMKEHKDPVTNATITDTFPIFAGCRFYNQTTRVVYTNGRSPITFVGFHIKKTNGPVFESVHSYHEQGGNLTFMDGVIELTNNGTAIDNDYQSKGKSIFMKDVYLKNAGTIIRSGSPTHTVTGTSGGWTEVLELGRALTGVNKKGRNLINGVQGSETPNTSSTTINRNFPAGSVPNADSIVNNHIWDESTFPAFDDPDTFNAVVDGGISNTWGGDVTAALNNILATHDKVFLPKGLYKISGTIRIPGDTKFFGISRTNTVLRPNYNAWNPGTEKYMVETDNNPNASPLLSNIWFDFTHLNPGRNISIYHWRAGRKSMIRNTFAWDQRWGGAGGFTGLNKKLHKFSGGGGGRVYGLTTSWQRMGNSSSHNEFRSIFVDGTTEPLNFYGFNVERQISTYQSEFRNASNIAVFGAKTEGENPNAHLIGWEDLKPMLGIVGCDNIIVGTVATSVIGCKDGWVKVIDSTNILCANITTQNHQSGIDLIQETYNGNTYSVSAQTYAALGTFKRGEATLMDFENSSGGSNNYPNGNLFVNGNFESGEMSDYIGNGAIISGANVFSGNYSAEITNNGTWQRIEQTLPISGDVAYTVSGFVDVSGTGASGNAQFVVQWLDSNGATIGGNNLVMPVITSDTPWTHYSNVMTSPSNAVSARIRVLSNSIPAGGFVRADNLVMFDASTPIYANDGSGVDITTDFTNINGASMNEFSYVGGKINGATSWRRIKLTAASAAYWTDYSLDVDVENVTHGAGKNVACVLLRCVGGENYYGVLIDGANDLYVGKKVNGVYTWTNGGNVNADFNAYSLSLKVTGFDTVNIEIYVNGSSTPDMTYTDLSNPHTSGGFGFETRSNNVTFDNIVATYAIPSLSTVNGAPVVAAISNASVAENASTQVSVSATDPNGDPLILSASGLPEFGNLTDNGDGTGSINFTPGFNDAGSYTITVSASDGNGGSESVSFDLTVNNTNRQPSLNGIGAQIAEAECMYVLSITATDADVDDALSISVSGLPVFGSFVDNGNRTAHIILSPASADIGDYSLTVSIDDGNTTLNTDDITFSLSVIAGP